jgi:hypothetical protein
VIDDWAFSGEEERYSGGLHVYLTFAWIRWVRLVDFHGGTAKWVDTPRPRQITSQYGADSSLATFCNRELRG